MGAVFRAHDAQLERDVAIKLLPLDQTTDPEIVQRFYQEGRASAQLDHENIARVYSIGQDGPHHFIAFEFIEGITVRRRVDENGPLPVNEAVDITLQIAQALVHAAERGVVHRDIKPSNIILTPQGRAKLVDMGLARRFEREADHGLTQSGMTLGTFDYISPEQARDPRDVDVRSDLYSLGCTLFHMLTGRPPFPGGTVLQKLLQHQEEPPPDVRSLNPSVPVELARIITKLLAKDRDRRYQSPEQLVRDLLSLAGHIGLALSQSNHHAWMVDGHHLTWQHHQIWFLPVLAFLVVVAGLVWWGKELTNPARLEPGFGSIRPPRNETGLNTKTVPPPAESAASSSRDKPEIDALAQVPSLQPNITVRPSDDLLSVIAKAPRRSTITLTEDGPYLLGGRTAEFRGSWSLLNRDVTIKAEGGTRPVLRFAADARLGEHPLPALLPFSGGNVTIEGLVFELDPEAGEESGAAVLVEDTELTIRGCSFRQSAVHGGGNRAALRIRMLKTATATGDRPPAVLADACHFDGGQVGIHLEGPADLLLRDCTMGPGSPMIWFDNRHAVSQVPIDLRLRHTSLMAGPGPVLQIQGARARVSVDDCVIASASSSRSALPTLVAVDNPGDLIWHGRSNLYARIGAYLQSTRKGEGREAIVDFSRWEDPTNQVREKDSTTVSTSVWMAPQPLQKLVIDQEDPTRAFELATVYQQGPGYGARQGPQGTLLLSQRVERRSAPSSGEGEILYGADRQQGASGKSESRADQPAPAKSGGNPSSPSINIASSEAKSDAGSPSATVDESTSLPAMPPMVTPPLEPETPAPANDARLEANASNPSPRERAEPGRPGEEGAVTGAKEANHENSDEDLIRSAEQFVNTLNRLGPKGGTLRLAREADIELPATELAGFAQWLIAAGPGSGPGRPRIRFRPSVFAARTPTAWAVLFNLRTGALHLQGLDLLIQDQDRDAPLTSRLAAIGVAPGTELSLTDCTITVASRSASSSAVVVQSGSAEPLTPDPSSAPKNAVVKVRDGFLRSAGDFINVTSGRQVDLQIQNVLIGADGSLLHAMGSAQTQIDRSKTALKLKIDHTVARTSGGLVHLESTVNEAELPRAEIVAETSTFSTAGQGPLFRVDGQGQMDGLRDRIDWTEEKVAYDQITTYRRDQILQTGIVPRNYNRSDWRTAFDPKVESPVLDEVRFLKKLEPGRPAVSLTKDDLTIDPQSPGAKSGPDPRSIPSPPPVDS
jgi:serine/threonine-protein kinase